MLHLSKGIKTSAALLCLLSLTLTGCSLISSGDARRDESGRPTETSKADAFKVKVGDCIANPPSGEVIDVTIIPCDQSHDLEAYASSNIDASTFPGDASVVTQAEEYCGAQFSTFVGKAYEESTLEVTYFHPTSDSWKTGDREIVCLIGGASGSAVTGTLKASAK
ncbi:septum formation family protein [Paenarthrobacter sp. NPDC092416]|uniref:septum formation family protein n=1 Tax=Paenarthrobacter sp. NPDC092416 TaxID=3364386 RepID=UPI00381ADFB5